MRPSSTQLGPRIWMALALFGALAPALAGCWPGRKEVYDGITADRMKVYEKWREQEGVDEYMPRIVGPLQLEDAVRLALLHNPSIKAILDEKAKGEGRIYEAYSFALPSLQASGNYTRREESSFITGGTLSSYSASLQVVQPLYRGGATGAAMRGARLFRYLADERVRSTVQDVAYRVARNYWDHQLAQRLYDVQKVGLESAQRQLEDVEVKLEQGVATEFDRLRARVEVANFRTEMIQQSNRMRLARSELLRTIGVSQQSLAEPAEELPQRSVEMEYVDAVRIASLNRPDLFIADLDVLLQDEILAVVRSDWLPKFDAIGTMLWSRPHPATFQDNWGRQWTIGLSGTWALFDGLGTYGRIVQQEAEIRQAHTRVIDTLQGALLAVKQALLDLEDTRELVEAQRLNQESAQLALELAEVGKEAGVRTDLQVIDARAALVRARGLYFQALHAQAIAHMDLERALGLLAPRPGQSTFDAQVPVPGRLDRLSAVGE